MLLKSRWSRMMTHCTYSQSLRLESISGICLCLKDPIFDQEINFNFYSSVGWVVAYENLIEQRKRTAFNSQSRFQTGFYNRCSSKMPLVTCNANSKKRSNDATATQRGRRLKSEFALSYMREVVVLLSVLRHSHCRCVVRVKFPFHVKTANAYESGGFIVGYKYTCLANLVGLQWSQVED